MILCCVMSICNDDIRHKIFIACHDISYHITNRMYDVYFDVSHIMYTSLYEKNVIVHNLFYLSLSLFMKRYSSHLLPPVLLFIPFPSINLNNIHIRRHHFKFVTSFLILNFPVFVFYFHFHLRFLFLLFHFYFFTSQFYRTHRCDDKGPINLSRIHRIWTFSSTNMLRRFLQSG